MNKTTTKHLILSRMLTLAPPLFALDACQLLELLSSDEAFAAWKQRLEQKSQLFELPPDWGELLPKLRDGLCNIITVSTFFLGGGRW